MKPMKRAVEIADAFGYPDYSQAEQEEIAQLISDAVRPLRDILQNIMRMAWNQGDESVLEEARQELARWKDIE